MSAVPHYSILQSYWYIKRHSVKAHVAKVFGDSLAAGDTELLFFLDSGAFSALTQGAEITMAEYGAYAQANQADCHLVANLDVIGHDADSAEASYRNWRTLREEYGVKALPVMHIGEPMEYLDKYLDAGEDYIAVGGLTQTPWSVAAPWSIAAFKRAEGHAVFHGFGVSGFRSQRFLPWYTVDHTTWNMSVRRAMLMLFDTKQNKPIAFRIPRPGSAMDSSAYAADFNRVVRSYGVDPTTVRSVSGRESRDAVVGLSACSVYRQDAWMQKRHGLVLHPTGYGPPGRRTFLASTSPPDLSYGLSAIRRCDI